MRRPRHAVVTTWTPLWSRAWRRTSRRIAVARRASRGVRPMHAHPETRPTTVREELARDRRRQLRFGFAGGAFAGLTTVADAFWPARLEP